MILAIDTSCDETAAAVTHDLKILSNVVWSQAKVHAKWGGVMPSEAKRMHEERIDEIVNLAVEQAAIDPQLLHAIAVTTGPGLAIALGVGIQKAKQLATEWGKPLIAVNHIEGHVLSPLVENIQDLETKPMNTKNVSFPAMALVISGAHTELIHVEKVGKYKIVARAIDDALGEALDKAARMLGLGYPGGALLEKVSHQGKLGDYPLPLPMARREDRGEFSFSGLKTAFYRLVEKLKAQNSTLSPTQVANLALSFQDKAFLHLTRVLQRRLKDFPAMDLLVGGGVVANEELRKRLTTLGEASGMSVRFSPKSLCGDNAAMIGVAAGFKFATGEITPLESVDRLPKWKIDEKVVYNTSQAAKVD